MAEDDLRSKIRKLRESIPDEDSSVTHIHVHGTSNKIVAHANDVKQSMTDPPKSKPTVVSVLALMPPWGRVVVALALIGAAVYTGHSLGWW